MRLRHRVAILDHRLQRSARRLSIAVTPKSIHDLRVAVRRLRVVLHAYRVEFDATALEEFEIALKQFTRNLEKARDADVLQGELAQLARSHASIVSSASRVLHGRAVKAYEAAVSELRIAVAGTPWQERLRHIRELSLRPSLVRANDTSATKAQNRLLNRSRSRLRQAIRHARKRPAKLHRVRLKVKTARYLLEDSLSNRMMESSSELKSLRKLQDCLGDFHDEEILIKTISLSLHDRSQVRLIRAKIRQRKRRQLCAYKAHSHTLLKLWDRTP
jgi:CHAD domain-containing protein